MMLDAAKPLEVIPFWDPAINIAKSSLKKYVETWDRTLLEMHPGKHPTVFVCRPIPNWMVFQHLHSEINDGMRSMKAFQASVVKVTNAKLRDGRNVADWEPSSVAESEPSVLAEKVEVLGRDELNYFWPAEVTCVGLAVCRHTFLPPTIGGGLPLPPTLLQLLVASRELFVALLKDTVAENGKSGGTRVAEMMLAAEGEDAPGPVIVTGTPTVSEDANATTPSPPNGGVSST